MKEKFFPYNWHIENFECVKDNYFGSVLRHQEMSVDLFGKMDLTHEIEKLKDKVNLLEEQLSLKNKENIKPLLQVSDDDAIEEIESFIKQKKGKGVKTVNILDLMQDLNLPTERIEKIMKTLESKGVREINE